MKKPTEQNKEYCEATLELIKSLEEGFLVLGERLMKIRDDKLFDPQWTSFWEYLQERKMSEGTASKIITVYKRFVLEFGFSHEALTAAGGWSQLYEVQKFIKNKDDADKWIHNMTHSTGEDIRKITREAKTGKDMAQCPHQDTYLLKVCRTCGDKWTVYEDDKNTHTHTEKIVA